MIDAFEKWRGGLAKTSKTAFGQLAHLLGATEITRETWDDLEALLIQADLGIETTSEVLGQWQETPGEFVAHVGCGQTPEQLQDLGRCRGPR